MQESGSPTAADDVTLLSAFNQIRLDAERKHDFVASETVGYLRVTASTGSLLSATKVGYSSGAPSGSSLSVKKLRWGRTRDAANDGWVPATFMKKDTYEALLVNGNRRNEGYYNMEQERNTFDESRLPETRNLLLMDGFSMYSLRDTDVDCQLWVNSWLTAYASFAATDDWFITYCADYLQWAAVVFMNKKKGVFLQRNEGSLGEDSAVAMRDAAWDSVLLWDADQRNYTNFIGA